MVSATKMSTKGQIVIPKRLREELGLQPGDPLAMAVDGERLILRKITLNDMLQESTKNYSKGKTLFHEETFEDLV